MIGFLFRFLSRFFFRFLLAALVFVIGNLLSGGRSREPARDGGDSGKRGSGGTRTPAGAAKRPPIDRSNVLDVPFTEVPPPGEAPRGPTGDAGRDA